MDATTEAIAGYVASLDGGDLTPEATAAATLRIVDAVGCAIGGLDGPPAVIARRLAAETRGTRRGATVFGSDAPSSMDMAAFANAVMVRYLDFNDMYFTERGGGGHPSDMLAPLLAVGEAVGASCRQLITAAVAAYEVNGTLAGQVWLRPRGWDQGLNIVAAVAMGAGKLLGLSQEQLGHALSLAVTPHVPVRQTRVGELSMWKGCATAGAARNGIFAALLAEQGMTGPPDPYEGKSGLWELVTGPFEIRFPAWETGFAIEHAATKMHPAEYNAQAPLDLMTQLRPEIPLAEVDSIDVDTYFLAYDEIGSQVEKWDPQTRETADHSIPYLLAVALVDGGIGRASFTRERILDPALRPLMAKIEVHHNEEFTERFPGELNCAITVRLASGKEVSGHLTHPRGHPRNPIERADLDAKYRRIVAEYRPPAESAACEEALAALWSIDDADDLSEVIEPLRSLSGA